MSWDLHLWQQGVLLVACLVMAWAPVALMRRRFHAGEDSVWFGRRVIDGVLFPMLALLLAWVALRWAQHVGIGTQFLRHALPILTSLLLIRLVVRVLQLALPASSWAQAAERWVSWLAWGGSILWISGLWPTAWAELDSIRWKLGSTPISLAELLQAAFNVVLVLVVTLWLSAVIESRLLRHATQDLSARKIVANLVKAALLLIGLLVALSSAGIDLTALGVMGGALGVGIGLGLQRLAANYVSGFVILAERSLRIGDVVRVDGFEGRVSDIKTRFTVIRAVNGRESIVPNELLITQRVENSSLADTRVAQTTVVSVGYDTDLDALFPKLCAAVAAVPRVQPDPSIQLSNFGADGLELTVVFWIADPENGSGNVRSEVNLAVLALLRQEGVAIPYPQRVVHSA
ncbi:mechanosensitive ion channel family protein [Inhella sp.]|uniref:mechanosensitive ion channel family protein n=1 Tax=Inhella sp. TaxID=1921806 RepID=UPI0035B0F665